MTKTITVQLELPAVLPHGWKSKVAGLLGVHINTVTNALKKGHGETYDRIITTARNHYGKPIKR